MFIEAKAQQAADSADMGRGVRIAYCVTLTSGDKLYTGMDGRILYDSGRDMGPFSDQWRIVWFKLRPNSRETISLDEASSGRYSLHPHVIDFDHGWVRQSADKAARVEFNDTGRDGRPLFEAVPDESELSADHDTGHFDTFPGCPDCDAEKAGAITKGETA